MPVADCITVERHLKGFKLVFHVDVRLLTEVLEFYSIVVEFFVSLLRHSHFPLVVRFFLGIFEGGSQVKQVSLV